MLPFRAYDARPVLVHRCGNGKRVLAIEKDSKIWWDRGRAGREGNNNVQHSVPEASILLARTRLPFGTEERFWLLFDHGHCPCACHTYSCSCYQLNANASTCVPRTSGTPNTSCHFISSRLCLRNARTYNSCVASLSECVSKRPAFSLGKHTLTHTRTLCSSVFWCCGEPLLALPKCQRTRDRIVCTAVVTSLHTPNTHSHRATNNFYWYS